MKPFGERFDPGQLPYFKYRKALAELEVERGASLEVGDSDFSFSFSFIFKLHVASASRGSVVMSSKQCK